MTEDKVISIAEGSETTLLKYKDEISLRQALDRLSIQWRFNMRGMVPEFKLSGDEPWVRGTDRLIARIRAQIANQFMYQTDRGPKPLRFGEQTWATYFNALLYEAETDPFEEWLVSLPAWDGLERINTLLSVIFGAEDDDVVYWASSFMFLGPVARTAEPGCKLDEMPVLIGKQGIGKSHFVRALLPPDHPEWFADGLHLAADTKTKAEALQGRVVVEAGEMAGASRAELEALKAFITRQDDGNVRLAWRKNAETMLRRCIIVGTTNDPECLPNDPTGNRRFVPVLLNHGDDIGKLMDACRDQCWAEAIHIWRENREPPRLPRDLHHDQKHLVERHRKKDEMIEERVRELIRATMTMTQIADQMGLNREALQDMRLVRRIGSALKNEGWEKKDGRVGGKVKKMWHPP